MLRIVAFFALSALAVGFGAAASPEPTKISWGYVNPSSYYWDVYTAIELGYMTAENLDVDPLNIPSAGQGGRMLVSSGVDILSSNMEVAISAIEQGADLVFVGGELARASFALTVRPDIQAYADLKGQTLGVTQLNEASTTMLRRLLRKNGVPDAAYDLVTVGGTPNRLAALKSGVIAATMLSQPADFQAQSLGMRILGHAHEAFEGPVVSFTVQRGWAKANGDTLVRFLRATAKGSRWLFDPANRAKAAEILSKNTKIEPKDALANYDLFFGGQAMMARDLALPESGVQAYLDMRASKSDPARYLDMSYAQKALSP